MKRALAALIVAFALAACSTEAPEIKAAPELAPVNVNPNVNDHDPLFAHEYALGMAVPDHAPIRFPNVRGECEPGQKKSCDVLLPRRPDGTGPGGPFMRCMEMAEGPPLWNRSECATPIVVAFGDAPVAFTKPDRGQFTIGPFERTEWVTASTPWLALDLDGSGCIEREAELFRFDRLRSLDENRDGRIDAEDAAYAKLVLWSDANQDRRCVPTELRTLAAAGIVALDLADVAPRAIPFGSHEGERASLVFRDEQGALRTGRLIDVYLAPMTSRIASVH